MHARARLLSPCGICGRVGKKNTRNCSDPVLTAAEFDKIQALITSERKAIVIYQKRSKHSPQEVEQSLREAVQRHKFGILHVLDLKSTLQDKGIELDNEVRIYDVCNPLAASQALRQDLATATVLPCRIAVYSNAEGSTIATVKPTDLFAATGLRHADTLAQDVEREIIAIIDEAVA